MAFVKKTWKDRLAEYAGRRTLKRVSGSAESTMVVDVTRNEGTVSQAGDAFSAANMNDLEQRIADGFSGVLPLTGGTISGNLTVNGNLAGSAALTSAAQVAANTSAGKYITGLAAKEMGNNIGFVQKNGKWYLRNAWGADTEVPFSSKPTIKSIDDRIHGTYNSSTGTCTINLGITGNYTLWENLFIRVISTDSREAGIGYDYGNTMTYDNKTGILSITGLNARVSVIYYYFEI